MIRFITPIILLGIATSVFFLLVNPLYRGAGGISELRAQIVSYNEALDNSKALEAERDKLTQKYNSIDPNNLAKLTKLLPDSVDNIRLILEIEQIAIPYGMALKDIKYDANPTAKNAAPGVVAGRTVGPNQNYGIWNLQFSTEGSYNNFLSFLKDLENNLRIVDVATVDFASDNSPAGSAGSAPADYYKYNFSIKTYWLKN